MNKIRRIFPTILRRGLSLLLAVIMCLSLFPAISLPVHAETTYWGSIATEPAAGDGSTEKPYQITNGAELAYAIANNKSAILMNDIDLSAHEWLGAHYSSVLDGNGKMISGMKLGSASSPYKPVAPSSYAKVGGLVKQLKAGGIIKNLAVEMFLYVDGSESPNGLWVGGIASDCLGVIDGCTVTGSISITSPKYAIFAGGITGELGAAVAAVRNCANRISIRAEHTDATVKANLRVAGIVGNTGVAGGTISNCMNMGNIYARSMRVSGGNNAAAGICVVKQAVTISNCYNAGIITTADNSYRADVTVGGTKENCYYWDVSAKNYVMDGDTTVTYADNNALLGALNENVDDADANAGWLEWALGNDGYPVPGSDLLPKRLSGSLVINGDARYGQTITAVLTNCNEPNVSYQWRRSTENGFEAIAGATALAYTIAKADIGHILQLVVSADTYENVLAVDTSVVRKIAGPAAPSVTGVDATTTAAKNGKLVGTTTAMEYSRFADFSTAYDCSANQTTNLAPGVYYVRVKATEITEAGAYALIVIQDASAPDLGDWTDDGNYTSGTLSGSGTQSDPYLIKNAADLAKLAKEYNTAAASAGKYFKITATEIDLSGHEWVPITTFSGILDGGNVKIRGLYIGTEAFPAEYANVGLFGELKAGAEVKNLNINGTIYVNSTSATIVGMVAGKVSGTIDHCIVSGKINVQSGAYAIAGGIAGQVIVDTTDVRLTNLGSSVDVYVMGGAGGQSHVGGIVGHVQHQPTDTTNLKIVYILNCFNTGDVTGGVPSDGSENRVRVGGIVGWLRGTKEGATSIALRNCYNIGKPTVISTGGGNNTKSTLDGIAGSTNAANRIDLGNCYSLDGAAQASDTANIEGKISGDPMSLAEMQSPEFAISLSVNANALKNAGYGDMYAWTTTEDGTPVLTNNKVTGTAKSLQVSANSTRLGSWKVEISAGGIGAYTTVNSFALAEKGDKVRITFLPTDGCAAQTVTVNGTPVTVTNNTYTFAIEEDTTAQVVFTVVSTVDKAPIYVNPVAAPGGNGSLGAPFSTLQEAVDKAEEVVAATANANVTIYLMGGTYVLDETIRLDSAISSLGRVTFRNYNEGKVTVTSSHKINGAWTKVEGKNYYSYQLPATSGKYPAFRDLLVNGARAQLARSKEYVYKLNWENAVMNGSKVESADNLLYVSAEALAGITNANLNGIELGQLMEWKSQIFHISQITDVKKDTEQQISLRQDEFETLFNVDTNKYKLNNYVYWLQNHINFLDEPGEFYYDQQTGIVYYYPTSDVDITTAEIGYATQDYLFELEDVANITFDGITFTGTTANGITEKGLCTLLGNTYGVPVTSGQSDPGRSVPYAAIRGVSNVEGVTVQNCVFTELGSSAMIFELGIKDLTVTGNVMKNLAMGGIQVGRNQRVWNLGGVLGSSENVVISNNYITNVGLSIAGAPGIKVSRCENLAIQHNTIIHVPYSGIMIGFGWNVLESEAALKNLVNADISYNYIEDFLYKINDGGAIYTCGANADPSRTDLFLQIHHNYIRGGAHNKTYTGIYHDGSASNWHTHHNVVDGIVSKAGPMFFQDTVVSQYSHNITASNNYTSVSDIISTATTDRNVVLKDNTMVPDRNGLLAIPEAKAIMEAAGLEAAYAQIVDPMEVVLQIQDSQMHYVLQDDQEGDTVIRVKVTNNYDISKRFTLSIVGNLPDVVTYTVDGNGAELAPGQSVELTVIFTADKEKLYATDEVVCGFVITEENGKTTEFPRQFTFHTKRVLGNNILKGTPVVDGYLDEAYLNSAHITLSTTVTATFGPNQTSGNSGSAYLLWDENYVYAYIIVEDSTVMSRGVEYIKDRYNDGKGNPNDLWQTDGNEAYIWTNLRGDETKFGVDAFGIQRFTNSNVTFDKVDALQSATKFTHNGQILDDYMVENPTAGQFAGTKDRPVDGYVVEITLPLEYCTDLKTTGQPKVGDNIRFFIQLNDYSGDYTEATGEVKPNMVCMRTGTQFFLLTDGHVCEDVNDDHRCDHCNVIFGECVDEDKDHYCDRGCGTKLGNCKDADKDHHCDYGCKRRFGVHRDKDGDGLCEYCGEDPNVAEGSLFTTIINAILDFFRSIFALFGIKI